MPLQLSVDVFVATVFGRPCALIERRRNQLPQLKAGVPGVPKTTTCMPYHEEYPTVIDVTQNLLDFCT